MMMFILFAAAFLLRFYFIPAPGYINDVHAFKSWSIAAAQYSVHGIYNVIPADYVPFYYYFLKLIGLFYRIFYPSMPEQTYFLTVLVKMPAIVSDLATALIVYVIFRKLTTKTAAVLASAAVFFNPAYIFNSAFWGQVDSTSTLLLLLAVWLLLKNRFVWAWAVLVAVILFKLQFLVVIPVFAVATWRRGGLEKLITGLSAAWLSWIFILWPFYYFKTIDRVLDAIFVVVGAYPAISMNAFNIWWLYWRADARWVVDSELWLGLISYRSLGFILFGLFTLLILTWLNKKGDDDQTVLFSTGLVIFGFFMLPTEMHERYILPSLIFFLLAAWREWPLALIYVLLSVGTFFNMTFALNRPYTNSVPAWLSQPGIDLAVTLINTGILVYFIIMLFKKIKPGKLILAVVVAVLLLGVVFIGARSPKKAPLEPVLLSDLTPVKAFQQWGKLNIDKSVDGNKLTVNGFIYRRGIGTHAYSELVYQIGGGYKRLTGAAGLDDEANLGNKIGFIIEADQKRIYVSPVLQGRRNPVQFDLDISGVKELKLIAWNGGDGINCDHADWLGVKLLP